MTSFDRTGESSMVVFHRNAKSAGAIEETSLAARNIQTCRQVFRVVLACAIAATVSVSPVMAQFDRSYPEPISKLRGSLVLHGGGSVGQDVREKFLQLAGGKNAKLVVIPTADFDDAVSDQQIEIWQKFSPSSVTVLHANSRDEAMTKEFSSPLRECNAVWITGGKQSRLAEIYVGTPVEQSLIEVVQRGGVVGGSSAGAAICSRVMIVRGEERRGFDLIPGAVIDQHFSERQREARLRNILSAHPERVGLGIDEDTALVLRGRSLGVIGSGKVSVMILPGGKRELRKETLAAGQAADLVALSRAAVARQQAEFPPEKPRQPNVEQGTLVIVGGGGTPAGLLNRFIELAGGPDAPIVYVPCVEDETLLKTPDFVSVLQKAGAKNVSWIHTKDRRRANEDETILGPLRSAKGIWFGGGRQWNLVDSYQNTTAHQLMHNVLQQGGVIGGSSAGASIQGDYMPRGDPLGNRNIIAEGYERGLGFLTGVAIDQHFSQRKRGPEMEMLIRTYPQLLGIGIDEATAIIVRKQDAEVVGKNKVLFFDGRRTGMSGNPEQVELVAGDRFDLGTRKPISVAK